MTLRAPESTPSVPAGLAGRVSAVVGLDESTALLAPMSRRDAAPAKQDHGAPGAGFRAARPCSTYWSEKTVTAPPAYGTTVSRSRSAATRRLRCAGSVA